MCTVGSSYCTHGTLSTIQLYSGLEHGGVLRVLWRCRGARGRGRSSRSSLSEGAARFKRMATSVAILICGLSGAAAMGNPCTSLAAEICDQRDDCAWKGSTCVVKHIIASPRRLQAAVDHIICTSTCAHGAVVNDADGRCQMLGLVACDAEASHGHATCTSACSEGATVNDIDGRCAMLGLVACSGMDDPTYGGFLLGDACYPDADANECGAGLTCTETELDPSSVAEHQGTHCAHEEKCPAGLFCNFEFGSSGTCAACAACAGGCYSCGLPDEGSFDCSTECVENMGTCTPDGPLLCQSPLDTTGYIVTDETDLSGGQLLPLGFRV
jgi:hypothetical protein